MLKILVMMVNPGYSGSSLQSVHLLCSIFHHRHVLVHIPVLWIVGTCASKHQNEQENCTLE